jgi:hypothetical protein
MGSLHGMAVRGFGWDRWTALSEARMRSGSRVKAGVGSPDATLRETYSRSLCARADSRIINIFWYTSCFRCLLLRCDRL